jgi:outer membrane protein TolC
VPDGDSSIFATNPEERPDIRGAEVRLEAAGARVSAAKWSILPTVELSANTGSQFFRSLGTTTQSTWGASLTVSLPVLDGFDRSGRVREASANARAAHSSYEQLRRSASAEIVIAEIQREERQAQLAALRGQLEASERAFDESRRRYLAGLASVLDVLNAMNGMQQAELGVIRTHRTVLASWIQLRQAVGGPWTRGLRRRLLETS